MFKLIKGKVERDEPKIAIIMPVYAGDQVLALKLAIRSIQRQSVKCQFYIVIDGSINNALKLQLEACVGMLEILQVNENLGLAKALNYALDLLPLDKYDFIARMDADDFSTKDSMLKRLKVYT